MQIREMLITAHGLHQAGRIAEAISGYRRVLCALPNEADSWHLLGTAMLQTGHPAPAVACIRRALAAAPGRHDFRLNLGFALIDNGNAEAAVSALAAGSDSLSGQAAFWSAFASARKQAGDPSGATLALQKAILLEPGDSASTYNLALSLQEQNRNDDALDHYDRAIALQASGHIPFANRAQAYRALNRPVEAARDFKRALVLTPALPDLLNDLGIVLWEKKDSSHAIALYRYAFAAAPDNPEILRNLASAQLSAGNYETALGTYIDAMKRFPAVPTFVVRRAFGLPVVPQDVPQIDAAREKISAFLDSPEAKRIRLADPLNEIGAANFYLVYHGRNDRDLAVGISEFYRHACPTLNFTAPHAGDGPPPATRRIRLGICSTHLAGHTIGAVFGDLVTGIDRERFTLTLLRPPGLRDAAAADIASRFNEVVELPADISQAAEIAAASRLDALLYTDIGMEPFTYFLAHTRLAPVQWVTWGHPVTTGISTVDAYLSPDCFEPEGAEAHYSERLVRSPSIPMNYRDEHVPPAGAKSDFGLPDNRPLYLCPQNLFKLHPEFDLWLGDILRVDPKGTIGLIGGANSAWTKRVKDRLGPVLGADMERVRFVPFLPKVDYMRLLSAAEVMLDPIHFGGSNTTLGGFAAGTPAITWPSGFMRGRMTMGLYRTMGIEDCIASGRSDYASRATEIANDPAKRSDIVSRIRAARPAVVGTAGAALDLGNLLADAVSSRSGLR
ncbi:tetratricopeptide repeat protein [Nisaea sp.]|uniref:tetratricopeptide repeat protein n=1 Tax=Nisaea sp. TaxID=2024842 RepID=UPI0032643B23